MTKRLHSGLRLAIRKAGGKAALARKLGITAMAVEQWSKVPKGRIMEIHQLTGLPLKVLAPDLFKE